MAGEWFHILYSNVYGLRTRVLRLTNTYGPCMRIRDNRQTFLGIWIKLILEGNPFEVWGGTQLRDFLYVEDCVDALLLTMTRTEANAKIYNLGGNNIISLKDLADILVEINRSGNYVCREFPEDRKRIDIGDYYSDYSLIHKELGWEPRVTLEKGLEITLEYFRKHKENYL